MRDFWRRIREAFEESMRQQITALGFVFTLTVVLVGLAAFISGNNLLFLLLAALLSTLLISGFVSRLGWQDWNSSLNCLPTLWPGGSTRRSTFAIANT